MCDDTTETVIEIRGLGKRFGQFDAVVDLDLDVCQGEIFQGELETQVDCLLGKLKDAGLV